MKKKLSLLSSTLTIAYIDNCRYSSVLFYIKVVFVFVF